MKAPSPSAAEQRVSWRPGFDLLSRLCILLPVLPPVSCSSDVTSCLTWSWFVGCFRFHSRLLLPMSLPLCLQSMLVLSFTLSSRRRAGGAWSSRRLRQAVPCVRGERVLPRPALLFFRCRVPCPMCPPQMCPPLAPGFLLRERGQPGCRPPGSGHSSRPACAQHACQEHLCGLRSGASRRRRLPAPAAPAPVLLR